jgi:glycerophosphoryl diester phosphodiesterase
MGTLMTSDLFSGTAGAPPTPSNPPPPRLPITVIAHRGACADAPENTLAAAELAVEQHADMVEVDVQLTRDGQLVLLHDSTLRRTTDVRLRFPHRAPWDVSDFTLDEIRALDAGAWFDARYAGTRVPTLAELLTTLRGRAGVLLEVKAPARYPGMVMAVAAELDRAGWLGPDSGGRRLVVQSYDWDFMREFKRLAPAVGAGLLGGPPLRSRLAEPSLWADMVNRNHRRVTPRFVQAVHRYGMLTCPYTVDDPERMRTLIGMGVDGLITNRPGVLVDMLAAGPGSDQRAA